MPLSADQATRLGKLQTAYDKLISGQNVVIVREGNSTTQFGIGDTAKLRAEIEALNALASRSGRERGAVSFVLGHRGRCF